MRKLRIFMFDIVAPGVVVGWLLWKYPELLDTVVPWLIFGILWHLTLEIGEIHFFKEKSKRAYQTRGKRSMTWLIVFAIGGCISLVYWYSIGYGLAELAALAKKPPLPLVSEATKPPETKAQPPRGSAPEPEKPSPKAPPARPVPSVKKPESTPTFTEKAEYRISVGSNSMQMKPGSRATL